MAEISQESPLDQQASDRKTDSPKHNNELRGPDGLHSPSQQHQNPECLDQDQASLQNQSHLGRPDDLCLGEAKHLSTNYLDPLQDQHSPHDSHKEAEQHTERSSLDQDHIQDQDSVCSLNSVQAQKHDRLNGPPEHEVQVRVEAKDHTPQDQQEAQGVDQGLTETQDGSDRGLASDKDKTQHLSQVDHHLSLPVSVQLQDEQCQDRDSAQQQDRGQRAALGLDEDQDKSTADQDPQLLEPRCDSPHNILSYFTTKEQVQPPSSHDDLTVKRDSPHRVHRASPQDQDRASPQDPDRASPQDQDRAKRQGEDREASFVRETGSNPDRDLTTAAACEDEAGESGGSVPALVITQAEESRGPALAPAGPAEAQRADRPADLEIPAAASLPTVPSPSSSDGGDMACSDLMSLKSDTISLASETAGSRRSEEGQEDDTRSVAASSVMSFHRVQLDPVEKAWLRSSAEGNTAAQRRLLARDSSLALKKTALHWAAKQGRVEALDMMLRSGADVNVRSGYTALHLASIHGHQHIVQALINIYNAKTNVRDYHGKMAVHYWSGSTDIFTKPDCQTGGKLSQGRRTQRYALPSLRLSRSRSQGQLNLDFGTLPQSPQHDTLDLQI